jgi:hypothetical protein
MFVVYFLAKYLGLFFSLTFGLVVALLVVSTNQIVSISFLCTNLWFIRIKVIRPHNSSPSKCTRHNLVTSTIHQNILLQIQCSHSKKKNKTRRFVRCTRGATTGVTRHPRTVSKQTLTMIQSGTRFDVACWA